MNNGPLPTRLAFISDLPKLPPRTKVRFLGCVTNYNLSTGALTLQHAYPASLNPCPSVQVDAKLLLENMKSADTQVGEWVNVMGYIEREGNETPSSEGGDRNVAATDNRRQWKTQKVARDVKVQAVMLWSAGAVKLGEYEKNLESRMGVEKQVV